MSAVAMLQTHLTKIKLEHAEREAALVLRLRKAEAESASAVSAGRSTALFLSARGAEAAGVWASAR